MSAEQIHPVAAAGTAQDENEILSDAGVEISLHSLKASPDHRAPLELLSQVSLYSHTRNIQNALVWVHSNVILFDHYQFLKCVMGEEYKAALILCRKSTKTNNSMHC